MADGVGAILGGVVKSTIRFRTTGPNWMDDGSSGDDTEVCDVWVAAWWGAPFPA